jgi:hypothetical protein
MIKTCIHLLISCGVVTFFVGPATAQNTHTYSKAVQKVCANDYHTHCGQYVIETEATSSLHGQGRPRLYQTAEVAWNNEPIVRMFQAARPIPGVDTEPSFAFARPTQWFQSLRTI